MVKKEYDPKPHCPKCWSASVRLMYRINAETEGEELKHICTNCGYFWFTLCADAVEEE